MSTAQRKAIDIGPEGTTNPWTIWDYRIQRRYVGETNPAWIRMWVSWPRAQPTRGSDGNGVWDNDWLAHLDDQIRTANADGKSVMLCVWKTPLWIWPNGVPYNNYPSTWDPQLRCPPLSVVGPNGAWGQFINQLMWRYSPSNPNRVSTVWALEIMNEPNIQWWPQTEAVAVAAEMMRTIQIMKYLSGWQYGWPLILAPAIGDTYESSISRTPYHTFGNNLLNALPAGNGYFWWGDPLFCWSMHFHNDIENDRRGRTDPVSHNHVGYWRERLRTDTRWKGYLNANGGDPKIFLTEGGARLNQIGETDPTLQRNKQASLLWNTWDRMKNYPEGAGVELLAYYLYTSSPTYDCGLRDTAAI